MGLLILAPIKAVIGLSMRTSLMSILGGPVTGTMSGFRLAMLTLTMGMSGILPTVTMTMTRLSMTMTMSKIMVFVLVVRGIHPFVAGALLPTGAPVPERDEGTTCEIHVTWNNMNSLEM